MKTKLRQLSLHGLAFKWRVASRCKPVADGRDKPVRVDQLVVFRQAASRSPLRIVFTEGAVGGPEYVSRSGVVKFYSNQLLVNLHKPRTVEILTRRAMALGWSKCAPMEIVDGFSFVLALPLDAQQLIDENYLRDLQTT